MVCLMVSITLQQIDQPTNRMTEELVENFWNGILWEKSIYTIIKTTSEFRNVSVT